MLDKSCREGLFSPTTSNQTGGCCAMAIIKSYGATKEIERFSTKQGLRCASYTKNFQKWYRYSNVLSNIVTQLLDSIQCIPSVSKADHLFLEQVISLSVRYEVLFVTN